MLLFRERSVVLGDLLPRCVAAAEDVAIAFVVDEVGGLNDERMWLATRRTRKSEM